VSGGSVVLTITPNTEYHLSLLTDNGVDVTASVVNGTYTITDVTANHTIVATFSVNTVPALGIWGMLIAVTALGAFVDRSRRIRNHTP
jgi:hypothetical protein